MVNRNKSNCGLSGWIVLGLLGASTAWASSAPVVSNVATSQRQDGSKLVDIRYSLADADGDACTVSVQASSDGGATWTATVRSLTGDVGSGVRPGTGKHIVWDCRAKLPVAVLALGDSDPAHEPTDNPRTTAGNSTGTPRLPTARPPTLQRTPALRRTPSSNIASLAQSSLPIASSCDCDPLGRGDNDPSMIPGTGGRL